MPRSNTRDAPPTPSRLLERCRNINNREPFIELCGYYRAFVTSMCRLASHDYTTAEDLEQELWLAVQQAIDGFTYDPRRGRFRQWLKRIVNNKAIDILRQYGNSPIAPGGDAIVERQLDIEAYRHWQLTWCVFDTDDSTENRIGSLSTHELIELRDLVVARVRSRVREDAWDDFLRTTCEECPPSQVARDKGKRPNAVCMNRTRVREALQAEAAQLLASRASGDLTSRDIGQNA